MCAGNVLKITFTGDIMCGMAQNNACYVDGRYSYKRVFSPIRGFLKESDYVVGNLETPIAGKNKGYTNEEGLFNTPEEFVSDLREAGFNIFLLANNHILDRGVDGMIQTLDILEKEQIRYTGAYRTQSDNSNKILTIKEGGIIISLLSYTYGTNSEFNGCLLGDAEMGLVDLMKKQLHKGDGKFQYKRFIRPHILSKCLSLCSLIAKKIKIIKSVNEGIMDCVDCHEITNPQNAPYIDKMLGKIKKAAQLSDFVIFCPHVGGQYNSKIGDYTRYIFNTLLDTEVDMIVGNHPHCILKSGKINNKRFFYSLGNFSFTPGGKWYINNVYADYSILLHAYFDKTNRKLIKYTYSIIKNVISSDGITSVHLLYDIISNETDEQKKSHLINDLMAVTKRFTGYKEKNVCKEYLLEYNS